MSPAASHAAPLPLAGSDARFLCALAGASLPFTGAALGNNFAAVLVFFGVIPILDLIVGDDRRPQAPAAAKRGDAPFSALLYAYLPVHLGLIGWGAWLCATAGLSPWQTVGLALSVGIVTGSQGITIAHELGHRSGALPRLFAWILLHTVCYGHFTIEHNRGHHLRVATPEDPASARFGESLWAFLPRTLGGSFVHAWQLERERLGRSGNPAWWRNRLAWSVTASLAIALALGAAFGAAGAAFFFAQSAVAVLLLETVNYIEHYGLVRARGPDGRLEPVGPQHAWDAYPWVSNAFLVHLQRHADHHLHPGRHYQDLRRVDDSPKLPTGYAGMVLVALVPPLWFALMNPRVPAGSRRA